MNKFAVAFVGAVAASSSVALAGAWEPFQFEGAGSVSGPYTITLTDAEPSFDITDAFLSGDRFQIDFTSGQSFQSSVPGSVGADIGGDYDGAFISPDFSHGSLFLGAGTYTFSITVLDSPFGAGGAAYRSGVIPAPGALGLAALGLLAASRRRR